MAREIFLLIFTYITGVISFQCAKYEKLFDRQPTYITCTFDCCGISSNRHCCTPVWIVLLFVCLGIVVVGGTALAIYCIMKRSKQKYAKKHATGFGKYPQIRGPPKQHRFGGSRGKEKSDRNGRDDYEQREMSTLS